MRVLVKIELEDPLRNVLGFKPSNQIGLRRLQRLNDNLKLLPFVCKSVLKHFSSELPETFHVRRVWGYKVEISFEVVQRNVLNSLRSFRLVLMKFLPLSETTLCRPRLPTKQVNAASTTVDKSSEQVCKCIAFVAKHTNRQTYPFMRGAFCNIELLSSKGPAKSIPVT